jgi:hypothetical protein
LVAGFIDHLEIVPTSNYRAITNSHTLQFSTARTKCSQSLVVNSRCLLTASNNGRSHSSGFPEEKLRCSLVIILKELTVFSKVKYT